MLIPIIANDDIKGRNNARINDPLSIIPWLAYVLDLVQRLVLLEVGGIAQSNNW